ncbi:MULTISPECIES: AraC family transcriptional regulator [unclassified Aureimonas]|uniref:AraC family transcriptional regulator n=1 Tax=unclassified Aureimonas TaxID=2615206 RepID=UPI0006F4E16F|nr:MULTISPECIES: AraC family transcriptional regulator [unclassified Aureimonas]KQT64193.1 AraC family transcriptional regulator [Aureimonas sp. Leaf427]KQT81382.1 AraC family transcriptional regulator [Aureimonas sp. Leaf460]
MDKPPPSVVALMVAWIEDHLDDPLTLDRIAAKSGYSPFHFSRLFLVEMRRSVMSHVRGRRLLRAARRLSEADLSLIDVALECGFGSQEAFTRAFKRLFGVTPARFRAGFSLDPFEGQFPMSTDPITTMTVERLPDLTDLSGFVVAGPARDFDHDTKSDIPQLWSQLIGTVPFEGQVEGSASYGVMTSLNRDEGNFRYLAGVEVRPGASLPRGFGSVAVPSATYAVFRITLDGGPIHLQMKAAMKDIWCRSLPESGLEIAETPDFERYDGNRPLTVPGATIDYYVPVRT